MKETISSTIVSLLYGWRKPFEKMPTFFEKGCALFEKRMHPFQKEVGAFPYKVYVQVINNR
jgi:hypothetical protein